MTTTFVDPLLLDVLAELVARAAELHCWWLARHRRVIGVLLVALAAEDPRRARELADRVGRALRLTASCRNAAPASDGPARCSAASVRSGPRCAGCSRACLLVGRIGAQHQGGSQ
jgi:hypothetical protein